jgi:phosphatidylserine/phosphatidylglycerophosphate/cardiolipin synthase-like enzyme
MRTCFVGMLFVALALTACDTGTSESGDGRDDSFLVTAKGDSPYGSCAGLQVLSLVNDPLVDVDALRTAGVTSRSADEILAYRNGPDGVAYSADDEIFDDLNELDAVWWVGPKTLEALVHAVAHRCEAIPTAEVIFSPMDYEESHLVRVRELIEGAQVSVDVAMYSFSDHGILGALESAVARGVRIRFLFEKARKEKSDPEGTWSAKIEDGGIDVRYINKIMHHKFIIVDGPVDTVDAAYTGTLVTGSGNWSYWAGIFYDENTVFLSGSGELLLRFQQEYNTLWENSRDLEWTFDSDFVTSRPITDALIVDDPGTDTAFTSANFDVKTTSYGQTFSLVTGRNTVADALILRIEAATESIHVASGHLRSRPVSEALLAKAAAHPEMDIRILLDNQEYIDAEKAAEQDAALAACLTAAGDSASKIRQCQDKGYYFSYPLHAAGVPLRFKTYCYRWHFSYAAQMHHKVMIFDGRVLASGSYNLSDNAEHNTMENMVFYDASRFGDLVASFEANFESLWSQGEAENRYPALLELIDTAADGIPLVFEPMALGWDEVTVLKAQIRERCPEVESEASSSDPASNTWCDLLD